MSTEPIVFIAFEEYDNLGVGYISSVLSDAGYEISVLDIREGKKEILKNIKKAKPLIVGFSIIFQNYIDQFAELITYLRNGGIKAHFAAGGQYASLRYENLFEKISQLDSIVRFDGEYTFLDLVNCIYTGKDWRKISGIAYQISGKLEVNTLRPVERDLDAYPFPMRSPLKEYAFGKKYATILAGRGCVNNCSFCSMNEYYRLSTGPVKRIRKPEKVVEEMELLYRQKECSVFLFQDDDFPVKTMKGAEWIEIFCRELKRKNLTDKIMWKINCRPDEVDHDSFTMMKDHGLFLVFLGIEDGTDIGLVRLNKKMTIAKSLKGVNILKKLRIGFDYGFMPFQPSSTYASVKENFDFLRSICNSGYTSVIFLKMMPYCATAIEMELRNAGRLKGKDGFLDYDFFDKSLNHYYEYISACFLKWLGDPDGLLNNLRLARNYLSVFSRYFGSIPELSAIKKEVSTITAESNSFFLDTLQELAPVFESGKYNSGDYDGLNFYRKNIGVKHEQFKERLKYTVAKLFILTQFPILVH